MKRKMLSILLALCMVVSLLPTMAFAEVEVTTHHTCDAFCGHVDGDPHSDSNLTWKPWNSTTTPPSSGNYYLTENVTLSAPCKVSGTLNLCLNGHTITPSGSGFSAIEVTGSLSLTDCRGTGKITGFTNDSGKGGAVYVASDKQFTMYGGIISGNKVTYEYNNGGMGGGVYSNGTFTMYGGTISGNEAERYGGGVYIAPGKQFTMSGGTIENNKITLSGDYYNFGGGGVYSEGTFTMSGGIIKNNKTNTIGKGGGVCISNIFDSTATSTFTMSDGTISGNEAPDGGGVYINSYKKFTMDDGTISGNNAIGGNNTNNTGGGVRVNGTFTMNNGTISGNNAVYGGGVYISPTNASFTMTGGNITGNAATKNGGGVCMFKGAKAFELSDSPIISGNTGSNCYIDNHDNCFMTVTGALGENAEIGITTWSPGSSYPFCKPADDDSINLSNYKDRFFSDSVDYAIAKNGDGFLYTKEVPTYTVTFNANGATGTAPTQSKTAAGGTFLLPAATDLAKAGYTFAGWNDGTTTYQAGATYTMPAKAVTFIAQWEVIPTYTVTFDENGQGAAPDAITGVTSGSTITAPTAPTAVGYTFGGWYKESTCVNKWDFSTDTVSADTTLYAKWTEDTPPTYTVTFDANGHGTAPTAQTVTSGETADEPTPPTADGYTFGGWYTDENCAAVFDFSTPIAGDITLYAKWTEDAPAPTPPPTPITYYDLWVGGVQVSDANEDDITAAITAAGDTATGSATYDPDTKTLTLTDFQYAGEYWPDDADESSAIRVKENGITIVFSGENMIEGTGYCGLYADVGDHIKLKAADKNSTLTFTCENEKAFWHVPEFVGSIAIYAGSSEADAKFRTLSAFDDYPYYDFKYVKFVPATPTPPIATPTPSVKMDVEDATLNDAAKAVGSAVKSGNADIIPAEGYTKESIAKMQNSGELNLVIEKNAGYDEAEKKLLDDAITAKGGAAGSVMYLEIDALLMSDDGKVVAEVDDTIVDLTITVDLNAEMQKAAKEGKTIYVARAHDGKVAFLEGTLNADKTKVTFDSSKFSTYALVASDSQTVTSPQTADAGIFLAVSMSVLSVTGSAVLLKKKED